MGEVNNKQEWSVKFLLAEFANIESERTRLKNEAVRRFNVFLTLTSAIASAIGGGLLLATRLSITIEIEYALIPLGFLSIIGWQTVFYIVRRDIATDEKVRACGRIRRFFVDNDPSIEKHLMQPYHDEPSEYVLRNKSTIRCTCQVVTALLLSLIIGIAVNLFIQKTWIAALAGLCCFVILPIGIGAYAKTKFKEAATKAQKESKYPKSESGKP